MAQWVGWMQSGRVNAPARRDTRPRGPAQRIVAVYVRAIHVPSPRTGPHGPEPSRSAGLGVRHRTVAVRRRTGTGGCPVEQTGASPAWLHPRPHRNGRRTQKPTRAFSCRLVQSDTGPPRSVYTTPPAICHKPVTSAIREGGAHRAGNLGGGTCASDVRLGLLSGRGSRPRSSLLRTRRPTTRRQCDNRRGAVDLFPLCYERVLGSGFSEEPVTGT